MVVVLEIREDWLKAETMRLRLPSGHEVVYTMTVPIDYLKTWYEPA